MLSPEQFLEDVQLLEDRRIRIVRTRDEKGNELVMGRDTIHAMAEVVRCLDRQKATSSGDKA